MPRKVFVAGEILTAADVNTNLMDQAVMTFAGTAARGSAIPSPSEGMVTYLADSNDIEKYDGSAWVNAAPQTILQVVQTSKNDAYTSSSLGSGGESGLITGYNLTITPSSATSKILLVFNCYIPILSGLSIYRDGSRLTALKGADVTEATRGDANTNSGNISLFYLDSPATTSATTYAASMFQRWTGGSTALFFNRSEASGNGISYSTITAFEVAG